jgi:hypothetical protein
VGLRFDARLVAGVLLGTLAGDMALLAAAVAATAAAAAASVAATSAVAAAALVAVAGHVPLLATLVAPAPTAASTAVAAATAAVATVAATAVAAASVAAVPATTVPSAVGAGAARERAATGRGDVDGLRTPIAVGADLELDGVAVVEAAEAVGLEGGLVDEEIIASVVGGDEAEPLGGVEPLDAPLHPLRRHLNPLTPDPKNLETLALDWRRIVWDVLCAEEGDGGLHFITVFGGRGMGMEGAGAAKNACGPRENGQTSLTYGPGNNAGPRSSERTSAGQCELARNVTAAFPVEHSPPTPISSRHKAPAFQ